MVCFVCACVWHSILRTHQCLSALLTGVYVVSSQQTVHAHFARVINMFEKYPGDGNALTDSITRRRGDKTGVNKTSPLLPHLLNCVECAGRLLNLKRLRSPVYKPLRVVRVWVLNLISLSER
jgi:hypothetical protein